MHRFHENPEKIFLVILTFLEFRLIYTYLWEKWMRAPVLKQMGHKLLNKNVVGKILLTFLHYKDTIISK
jgi:hypothetical protein